MTSSWCVYNCWMSGKQCRSLIWCHILWHLIWVYTVCLGLSVLIPTVKAILLLCKNYNIPISIIRAMLWENAFGHMRTAKAQIRLRIRAVWSGPSLSTIRIIGYYRIYQLRAKPWMSLCTCAGWSDCAFCASLKTLFYLIWLIYGRLHENRTLFICTIYGKWTPTSANIYMQPNHT